MSFAFNFLPNEKGITNSSSHEHNETEVAKNIDTEAPPFEWISDARDAFLERIAAPPQHDEIPLVGGTENRASLRRVLDPNTSTKYKGTDLVPGVYEGGGVVWECSLDLCRFLQQNQIDVNGKFLELGCGHGLPGCWILKKASEERSLSTVVVFSDYNRFVLDATISNIVLNVLPADDKVKEVDKGSLCQWLLDHCALGAGDWHAMSRRLGSHDFPEALVCGLNDGKFDCILAAETTYSPKAAKDTAELVVRHLKHDTGVAYIATKRYYFGVGGGSDSFISNLQNLSSVFKAEVVQVYDNGTGNIRELIKVSPV